MRILGLAALIALVLVPSGGSATRSSIPAAAARAATAKIEEALTLERTALGVLGQKHPGIAAHVYLYQSADRLNAAAALIKGDQGAAPIVSGLDSGTANDHNAALNQSNAPKALEYVRKAIAAKKHAIAELSHYAVTTGSSCESEKPFPLYAVPAGYAGAYTDVYPHSVPKDAKNIQLKFVDAATGQPAPTDPFPGQSWTAKIVGFETRNGEPVLHVHIDITGTGYGKPDEHFVNWKIIVTWTC